MRRPARQSRRRGAAAQAAIPLLVTTCYLRAPDKLDWIGARDIVNGHRDQADLIAGYAKAYYAVLQTCTPW